MTASKEVVGGVNDAKNVCGKLERINNIVKDKAKNNARDLSKLKKEMYVKAKEFYKRWDEYVKFRDSKFKGLPDPTHNARRGAENFYNSISGNLNEQNIKQAIKHFNNAIESMNKFKKEKKEQKRTTMR